MGRDTPPLAVRLCAVCVIVLSVAFFAVMMKAIKSATDPSVWPNAGHFPQWTQIQTCNATLAHHGHPPGTEQKANFFTLHMFFMTLAFGFLGPVGSVLYVVMEDSLGVSHNMVKWTHALVQMGAVVASVLGFMQIYFSAGGPCGYSAHFLSLHSYVGIAVLATYWLQGPLALLIFSNKTLLKPGTLARKVFLVAHQQAGVAVTLLGPVVIMLGVVAFEVKKSQWVQDNGWIPDGIEIWYNFARAGMVAFGLLLLLGGVHLNRPAPQQGTAEGKAAPAVGTALHPYPGEAMDAVLVANPSPA